MIIFNLSIETKPGKEYCTATTFDARHTNHHLFSKFHHKNIDTKETKVYSISTFARINGCLAQLVEQWTVNPCVAGSKPAAAEKTSEISEVFFILTRNLIFPQKTRF